MSTVTMWKTILCTGLVTVLLFGWAVFPGSASADQTRKTVKTEGRTPQREARESRTKDIKKLKDKTIVSRALAERIKDDNTIVLSTVAIKPMTLKNKDTGFKIVQIDKGGVTEKMGFRAGDVIWKVNGLDMNAARERIGTLEKSDRFKVLILRGGKEKILRFQVE